MIILGRVGGRRLAVGGWRSEERTEKVCVIARMFVSNIRKLDWSVKYSNSQSILFRNPLNKAREIHLAKRCAFEGILTGVASKGEFHEIPQSASKALLTGVARMREIHLAKRCASEGTVEGVTLRGGHKVVLPQRATGPRSPSDGGRLKR